MARIEVEESALESIKAMNQQLQQERDELLGAIEAIVASDDLNELEQSHIEYARSVMQRCATTPKAMELSQQDQAKFEEWQKTN